MSEEAKQTHEGHRKRMKSALLENGAGGLNELDLLEMLLFYAVPRADTRATAKSLLDKFGSIEAILNADQGAISSVGNLKGNAEVLFILLRELFLRYGGTQSEPSFLEPNKMKRFLVDFYKEISVETVFAMYFAKSGNLVGKEVIFRGDISSARFSLRAITEGVIRAGGTGVVLVHNHPSDILVPSDDDIISTKRIAAHLAANDIELIEHYIVGKTDAVGFFADMKR